MNVGILPLETCELSFISRTYLTYTLDCETPYDMLVGLKQRIAPTDRARNSQQIQQVEKGSKNPKPRSLAEGMGKGLYRLQVAGFTRY